MNIVWQLHKIAMSWAEDLELVVVLGMEICNHMICRKKLNPFVAIKLLKLNVEVITMLVWIIKVKFSLEEELM